MNKNSREYYLHNIKQSHAAIIANVHDSKTKLLSKLITRYYQSVSYDPYCSEDKNRIYYIRNHDEVTKFEDDLKGLEIDFEFIKSEDLEDNPTNQGEKFLKNLEENFNWDFSSDFIDSKAEMKKIFDFINQDFKTFEEFLNSKLMDKIKSLILGKEFLSLHWIIDESEGFQEIYNAYVKSKITDD